MTDRALRVTSLIAVILLAINAIWLLLPWALPWVSTTFGLDPVLAPSSMAASLLTYQILPSSSVALGLVSGMIVLVISAQRRQWAWFTGAIICLIVYFYADILLSVPWFIQAAFEANRGSLTPGLYVRFVTFYSSALIVAPLVILALVYAWTRRHATTTSASV